MSLGFVGTGAMGVPMARNLWVHLRVAKEIYLHNRTRAKAEALAKELELLAQTEKRHFSLRRDVVISVEDDLQALVGKCGLLVLMLHGDEATLDTCTTITQAWQHLDPRDMLLRPKRFVAVVPGQEKGQGAEAKTRSDGGTQAQASEQQTAINGTLADISLIDEHDQHRGSGAGSSSPKREANSLPSSSKCGAEKATSSSPEHQALSKSPRLPGSIAVQGEQKKPPQFSACRLSGSLLVVNCGTVSLEAANEAATLMSNSHGEKGLEFAHCSITGRPEHAAKRMLCAWISSFDEPTAVRVRDEVAPAFARLARIISPTDPTASAKFKICTGFVVYGLGELFAETLTLLDAAGIERDRLLDFTQGGVLPGAIADTFATKLVRKDFRTQPVGTDLSEALHDIDLMKGIRKAGPPGGGIKPRLPLLDVIHGHLAKQSEACAMDRNSTGPVEWCSLLEIIEQEPYIADRGADGV
ncbi:unnamed protein product [Amoebophrya sp. A25]|nr:unnamed protein product [Amoebophrya sp. A25]|eukprot:GSA25T00005251001.1